MTIGIYAKAINHFIETLTDFISRDKRFRILLMTDTGNNAKTSEHPWCMDRLRRLANVEVISSDKPPEKLDWLYVHMPGNGLLWSKNLNGWLRNAKNVGCLRESHYRNTWKKAVKEVVYSFPYYFFARAIVLQDSIFTPAPYFFIKNKYFYSPSVHPQFFDNEDWGQRLFGPVEKSNKERTFKFAFIGTKDPLKRAILLRQIGKKFKNMENVVITASFPPGSVNRNKTNVLWIEYDSRGPKRGLNPAIYAEALNHTDFCICPVGWGGNWTHRVPESLLRGTIPVLEDEKRYNIGLKDMENCIVVKNSDWPAALEKAGKLDFNVIHGMRSNISRLREECILPQAAALRLRKSMGLG